MSTGRYVIYEDDPAGFVAYGANREFFYYTGPEAILSGPYETGKTIAALNKVHVVLSLYKGARALAVRKTYKSLVQSAVVTYEQKVLPAEPGTDECPVSLLGGTRPELYQYPNGSKLVLGGMDNAGKFLSSEWDLIYVNQAEELTLDDWEKLTGRATGRADNTPYAQVIGDANPDIPTHWILARPEIRLFNSKHEDNPTLYSPETGVITERGKRTMMTLDALTGLRYQRGRLGKWVGAEGQVYEEWSAQTHLVDAFEIPKGWTRFRAIDFGYTNPFVCQWWAIDEDGRMYLYRELYTTHRLVEDLTHEILELSEGEEIAYTVADHDAEDRATMAKHGIITIPANKAVKTGIEAVQKRIRVAGDGRPRVCILRDSLWEVDPSLETRHKPVCTSQELPGYVWEPQREGKAAKESPVKVDDHGCDTMRYAVMSVDGYESLEVFEVY